MAVTVVPLNVNPELSVNRPPVVEKGIRVVVNPESLTDVADNAPKEAASVPVKVPVTAKFPPTVVFVLVKAPLKVPAPVNTEVPVTVKFPPTAVFVLVKAPFNVVAPVTVKVPVLAVLDDNVTGLLMVTRDPVSVMVLLPILVVEVNLGTVFVVPAFKRMAGKQRQNMRERIFFMVIG